LIFHDSSTLLLNNDWILKIDDSLINDYAFIINVDAQVLTL